MGISKFVLKNSFVKSELNLKEALDNQASKNYAYYKRDHSDILSFLNIHLQNIISDERVLQLMPKVYVNDVHRVVKRLSLLYNNEPKRTFSKDITDDKILTVLSDAYTQFKEFHRMSKLLNTILVRPIWSEKRNKFIFLILGRHYATAITSEEHKHDLEEVWYLKEVMIKGEKEYVRIHWTDTDYWITDQEDNIINIEGLSDENNINPYGKIPFVELRLEDSTDYWGDGMSDFVNLTEANNAKLCDALYKQWLSFGYPIGTNLNVTADEFQIAPYKPIMTDNARTDQVSPNLTFVSPDHQIEQDKDLIDYMRRAGGTSQGLSASNFSNEITQQSGYAKTIDNQELLDQNKEDMPILRKFEFEMFEMMKLELEKRSNSVQFNFDLMGVEFEEYKFPLTEDEKHSQREFEYKYNMSSPIDWIREDTGISEEEAIKKIEENLNENKKIKDLERKNNLLDRILGAQNANNQN